MATPNIVLVVCVLFMSCFMGCGSGGTMESGAQPPAATMTTSPPPPSAPASPASTPAADTMPAAAQPAASTAPASPAGAAGTGGSNEPAMAAAPTTPTTGPAQPSQPTAAPTDPSQLDHTQDIRGHCGLKTNFADDNACLIPPRPNEGFQVHVGPKNYDDPAEVAKFVMKPGEESSECFTFRTDNAEKIVYQSWVMSGRAGTHHVINQTYSGEIPVGVFGNCGGIESFDITNPNPPMQNGSLPGASKSYMARAKVAPEYAHVGRVIEAKTLVQSDMHYFNFTDKDILREFWMNFYYPTAEQKITEYAEQLVGFGGTGWDSNPIQPGTDMVYKYECPFTGTGHLMQLLGHYHAHGKRFTSSIKRASGMIEKVFEMYDYLDPAVYDYNSVTQNPPFSAQASGAVSGPIAIMDGDILQWECHIINDSMVPLAFTNEVKTGEMCNIWGYTVGTEPFQCFLQ